MSIFYMIGFMSYINIISLKEIPCFKYPLIIIETNKLLI